MTFFPFSASASTNIGPCASFLLHIFSNLRSVGSFFCEKHFFGNLLTVINISFVKKILLKTAYLQKVRDPTFLWPIKLMLDVHLCKLKNSEFEIDVSPSTYNFLSIFSSSIPPPTCPLGIFFVSGDFVQFLSKKEVVNNLGHF